MAAVFGSILVAAAQDSPIFGYPYDTNGLSGGSAYEYNGAIFLLNGNATIDSISCKLWISYNSLQPTAISHYRYAIYQDNAGSVGNLIAQTDIAAKISQLTDHTTTINGEHLTCLRPCL
jgi:hypothetical protein